MHTKIKFFVENLQPLVKTKSRCHILAVYLSLQRTSLAFVDLVFAFKMTTQRMPWWSRREQELAGLGILSVNSCCGRMVEGATIP